MVKFLCYLCQCAGVVELADYPDVEAEDIRQALEYAAWLAQEEVYSA